MSLIAPILSLAMAQTGAASLTVHGDKPGIKVSPSLYGIFFEEINHAGDGGLYPELLQNPGMVMLGPDGTLREWKSSGGLAKLDAGHPMNPSRPSSLVVQGSVSNDGFWGIPLKKGSKYRLSLWVQGAGELKVRLGSASQTLRLKDKGYEKLSVLLTAAETTDKGSLVLEKTGSPALVSMASLKPAQTLGRAGLRQDLGGLIKEIGPSFVRFPGGCFVEGQDLGRAWDWKASLGPLESRPGKDWRFWGYSCTDGLGFHEYLQWCEDIGADGLFVVNCGMSHGPFVPMNEMDRVVQSALDAIEYARGPVSSKYGAMRAKAGHPKPFSLKYIEIGNENGGPLYNERYPLIAKAIGEKYPDIKLVACVWGGVPKSWPLQIIDEHYYSTPSFFWQNARKYDAYDRKGPKVYVGEFAVTQGCGLGNLAAALGEAAFMTGMERNSDIVTMSSYAPLFSNINGKQWNPNLIVFNNSESYGTPSYWVQKLFARNRPDVILPVDASVPLPHASLGGSFALQTWRTQAEYRNPMFQIGEEAAKPLTGWHGARGKWTVEPGLLTQTDTGDERRITSDAKVGPQDDFTFSVEAMKTGGSEGFMLLMGAGGESPLTWNLGGWENTANAFQNGAGRFDQTAPFKPIETGRWYSLRLQKAGQKVRGYVDGVLVQEVEIPRIPDFAATAGWDAARKEIVLKVVNGSSFDRPLSLDFKGAKLKGRASGWTLAGGSLMDENSFKEPLKVSPKPFKVRLASRPSWTFPARSLSIVRIPADRS